MLMETEAGIWARADAQVFRLLMDGDRSHRRLLAADRTIAGAIRRVEALRRRRGAQEAREGAAAERQLEREFAPAWGRAVRVRVPSIHGLAKATTERRHRATVLASTSRRAIKAYTTSIKDARGRVAVYFRVRYVGLKSKGWRPGLAADHALYILRDEAQEHDGIASVAMPISNMGESAEEIAAAWRALEAMEEGYRANAKVQYRIVWNLPHDLDASQRRELVEGFCERTFGRLGLPYVAAIHTADPKGDARNVHAHICFSTRPTEHVGDHQWVIAQEKVNGLTDPAGLTLMRALSAGHMNLACRSAGNDARYTHQSYAKRGIDAVRQTHLGPARMAAHERGEPVAAVTRNAAIVARNEAVVACDAAAQEATLAGRLTAVLWQRMTIGDEQRRVAGWAVAAQAIAARAKLLALRQRPARPLLEPSIVKLNAQHARAVATMLARQPDRAAMTSRKAAAHRLAADSRAVGAVVGNHNANRQTLAETHRRLTAICQRIADGRAAEASAARERMEALLFTAAVPPYVIDDSRLVLDVSQFAEADTAFILAADRAMLGDTLRERHLRDRRLDEVKAAEQRLAEEQRAAAETRQRQIADACRLLREVPGRPYKRNGNRLVPDLAVFNAADRAIVAEIGFGEAAMVNALIARATKDHVTDEPAATVDRSRRREAIERMFRALDEERHYLARIDGVWRIPSQLGVRFGVDGDAETDAGVQRRLSGVAERQADEVSRIAEHVLQAPHHLRHDNGRWTLDAAAPSDVRRAIDGWQRDPTMQAALARAATTVPVSPVTAVTPPPAAMQETEARQRTARASWEDAMPAADAIQHLDAAEPDKSHRPGVDRRVRLWPPPGTAGLDPGG